DAQQRNVCGSSRSHAFKERLPDSFVGLAVQGDVIHPFDEDDFSNGVGGILCARKTLVRPDTGSIGGGPSRCRVKTRNGTSGNASGRQFLNDSPRVNVVKNQLHRGVTRALLPSGINTWGGRLGYSRSNRRSFNSPAFNARPAAFPLQGPVLRDGVERSRPRRFRRSSNSGSRSSRAGVG